MDRTKEYYKIVQTSSMLQQRIQKVNSPYFELFKADDLIKNNITEILKCKYDLYNIKSKVNKVQQMCRDTLTKLEEIKIENNNKQEEEVYNNIHNIIKSRISEYKLSLIVYLRKNETKKETTRQFIGKSNVINEENISGLPKNTDIDKLQSSQQEMIIEESSIRERKQNNMQREITKQISEIGNIMEEIGIHVSLQEESFKRIDDLMGENEKFVGNSLRLLRTGLENVSSTRKSLLKFFSFWIFLALVFWLFKK